MRPVSEVLYNFHWIVAGEAARSAQAYAGFLGGFLKRRAIRSVINLRGPNPRFYWWRYEKRVCARLGIEHIDVAVNSRNLPSRKLLIALLRAFDDAPKPFVMKCSGGQDRTSFASALYLVHTRGWNALADAELQFASWPYLHWPRTQQRWLKTFLNFAEERAQRSPLAAWIETAYLPEDFAAWLAAKGMSDSYRNP